MHCWIIALVFFGLVMGDGSVKAKNENCDSMDPMRCLMSTKQSANELFFPDTQQKLRDYCTHVMSGLDCARRIIDECMSEMDKQMYYNLTHDMVGMNIALCTPGSSLSIRFLKHVDCYKNLSEKFRRCSDRYISNIVVVKGLSLEEQGKMTCCTVHEYSRCMRNAVEGRCEVDAQKLVEETVITSLKQSFSVCKTLGNDLTADCHRSFSASKGHATANLGEDGNHGGRESTSLTALLFLTLFLLIYWS